MGIRCEEFSIRSPRCPFGRGFPPGSSRSAFKGFTEEVLDHLERESNLIESEDEPLVRPMTGRNVVPRIGAEEPIL